MKGPLTISLLLLVGCDAISQGADEQILIHVFINNKPAALAFDTGAGVPAIFQSAAQRLGLQISNPPPDIGVAPAHGIYRQTESCKVATQLGEFETRFYVLEGQSAAVADGLFPWRWLTGRVLRINAFLLEAGGGCLELLSSLPPEVKSWTRLNVRTNEGVLTLEIPGSAPSTSIVLDTGFRGGVGLPPTRWREWRLSHTNEPTTLELGVFPALGSFIAEEMWAKNLTLGSFVLTDVPIMEVDVGKVFGDSAAEAILGIAALKRLEIVIDEPNSVVYLRPKTTPALPYKHNRLGAVFTKQVTRVAPNSPASEVGIHDGDQLLDHHIEDPKQLTIAETLSKTNNPFWMRAAGSKLDLTLMRGKTIFKTNVVLRTILGPSSASLPQPRPPERRLP